MKASSLLSVFIIIAVYFIGVLYLLTNVDVKQKNIAIDRQVFVIYKHCLVENF